MKLKIKYISLLLIINLLLGIFTYCGDSISDYNYIKKNDDFIFAIKCIKRENLHSFTFFLILKKDFDRSICIIGKKYPNQKNKDFYDRVSCRMKKYEIIEDLTNEPYIEFTLITQDNKTNIYKKLDTLTFEKGFCSGGSD